MAKLYIAEFFNPRYNGGNIGVVSGPPDVEQTVNIAGASAQSAAFNKDTKLIRVHTDVICSILVGTDPTATTGKMRLAADQTEYFEVAGGAKVAVISNT